MLRYFSVPQRGATVSNLHRTFCNLSTLHLWYSKAILYFSLWNVQVSCYGVRINPNPTPNKQSYRLDILKPFRSLYSVCTWRHGGHKQRNGSHVGGPNKSSGNWTRFLTFSFVLLKKHSDWSHEWKHHMSPQITRNTKLPFLSLFKTFPFLEYHLLCSNHFSFSTRAHAQFQMHIGPDRDTIITH